MMMLPASVKVFVYTQPTDIFKRHGVEINISTMCDWVTCCAVLLKPLTQRLREKIQTSLKVHCDATVVPVKSKKRKGST